MKGRRWLVIFLLLAAVAGALFYGFSPRPVLVETAVVARGPLRVTIEEEGKTRVKERFVVSAPVAGIVRRIELEVGDAVGQGQDVAVLEPLRAQILDPRSRAEAGARMAAAEAAFNAARENARASTAAADQAQAELKRLQRLQKAGAATVDALDRADTESRRSQAALRSAEYAVEVARFEWEAAQSALAYSAAQAGHEPPAEWINVKAPVNGRVLKVHQKSEQVVSPGQPLVEIGDPGALEVVVDVLSSDAVKLAPGTKVLFERWGGEGDLEGGVRVVEPVGFTKISALGVEEQRVQVIVDLNSARERWQRLGDGYRVEASFVLWEGEDVLQAPTSALFRQQNGWAVFVVDGSRARLRRVELGERSGLATAIVAGLAVGVHVVTHPDDKLADGARVDERNR